MSYDSIEFLLDRGEFLDLFVAEVPDGQMQQVVEILVLLNIILFSIFGWLYLVQILISWKSSSFQLINPLLFGVNQLEVTAFNDFCDESDLVL